MEKLELKHLAGYLPYGLKGLDLQNQEVKVIGVRDETYFIENGNNYAYGDICGLRPILRPLSDLTKEIEVNGEKFVPKDLLKKEFGAIVIYQYMNGQVEINKITNDYSEEVDLFIGYQIVQQLLEWHFDIYGLIPKGLAIDINTLK